MVQIELFNHINQEAMMCTRVLMVVELLQK